MAALKLKQGAFRSARVTSTLAVHMRAIEGSIGLQHIYGQDWEPLPPIGALGFCCAAVKILTFYDYS